MIKLYLFLIFSCVIFLTGIAVGHYEVFPFDFVKSLKYSLENNSKNEQINFSTYEDDVNSLIKLNSKNDIIEKRENLINFIWKDDMPYSSSLLIEKNIQDSRYQNLDNLKSISELNIQMDYQVNSIAYLFLAQNSNKAFPIIGVGGIHSAEDALDKIEAGADLVQIYTGFIYEGPGLIKQINKALLN